MTVSLILVHLELFQGMNQKQDYGQRKLLLKGTEVDMHVTKTELLLSSNTLRSPHEKSISII